VARGTARRAKAFGLRVIAHDPYVSELEIGAAEVEPVGFHELLERSDFLSIHAPLNAETEHAIDAAALSRMKPTAVVINTARGGIIDEGALTQALRAGVIAGAGLDVLEREPARPANPLLHMDSVLVTPHIASASSRMRPETRRRVGREVSLVLRGRWPMSCVNPTVLPRAPLERWQPYPMNRGPNR
jgi:D-3-phosphoglycerate dehydrogenase